MQGERLKALEESFYALACVVGEHLLMSGETILKPP